jgi:WD40 repeat protein
VVVVSITNTDVVFHFDVDLAFSGHAQKIFITICANCIAMNLLFVYGIGVFWKSKAKRILYKRVTIRVDNAARILDAATGELQRIFKGHSGSVTAVGFSPDGRQVAPGEF